MTSRRLLSTAAYSSALAASTTSEARAAGRWIAAFGLCLGLSLTLSTEAAAYCRTTTCQPAVRDCYRDGRPPRNGDNCVKPQEVPPVDSLPDVYQLAWPDTCVTFGVHVDGSPLRGIDYEEANRVAENAFLTWISADCGGPDIAGQDGGAPTRPHPSIAVLSKGEIYCDRVEYNHDCDDCGPNGTPSYVAPNANLIVFRDQGWPYVDIEDGAIALTTITFGLKTGEILDADIEVNSEGIEFSTSNSAVKNDLQSVLTHEIGHFFGLAHSPVTSASMYEKYDLGDVSFRSLSSDDRQGICDIYPPGLADIGECRGEGPRYGFSRYCGSGEAPPDASCSLAASPTLGGNRERSRQAYSSPDASWYGWGAAALMLGLGLSRRQRRRG